MKKFNGMGGMGNMAGMLKQAQKMQENIAKLQADLENREYIATSGGGMVKATVKGASLVSKLEINPEVIDANDAEMLQDLILAAVNEALKLADETSASEMKKITGGMGLPGGMF